MGSKTQFQKQNRTESNKWGAVTPARSGPYWGLEAGYSGPSGAKSAHREIGNQSQAHWAKDLWLRKQQRKHKRERGRGRTASVYIALSMCQALLFILYPS